MAIRRRYQSLIAEAGAAFEHGDLPQVVRLLDRYFGGMPYSLRSLFRDEQRRILDRILASTLAEVEGEFRQIYAQHAPLMRFLKTLGTPLPKAFAAAAELVLNVDLRRAVSDSDADPEDRREAPGGARGARRRAGRPGPLLRPQGQRWTP